jgi:ABC-2 type transport system ATP-binding protein
MPRSTSAGGLFAVEALELVKTYRGGVRALDGLTFGVEVGAVFALLGPSGAGKSTAVKILTTLSRPDSGRAWVAGAEVRADPDAVRRRIGYVGQVSSAARDATGRENLHLAGRTHGLSGRVLGTRVGELLERFDLSDAADRPARTYSDGMLRKLDVARGLVHEPSVLFLDEPTAGLDPQSSVQLRAEIGRLSHDEGRTVLLTTRDLDEADRLVCELAIVDRGQVVAQGSPGQLKADLRRDTVTVELAPRVEPDHRREITARTALDRVPIVRDVVVAASRVIARADAGAGAVPAVVAALEGAGVGVAAVTVARPSLDDVYLRYTGHRYTGHSWFGAGGRFGVGSVSSRRAADPEDGRAAAPVPR